MDNQDVKTAHEMPDKLRELTEIVNNHADVLQLIQAAFSEMDDRVKYLEERANIK